MKILTPPSVRIYIRKQWGTFIMPAPLVRLGLPRPQWAREPFGSLENKDSCSTFRGFRGASHRVASVAQTHARGRFANPPTPNFVSSQTAATQDGAPIMCGSRGLGRRRGVSAGEPRERPLPPAVPHVSPVLPVEGLLRLYVSENGCGRRLCGRPSSSLTDLGVVLRLARTCVVPVSCSAAFAATSGRDNRVLPLPTWML